MTIAGVVTQHDIEAGLRALGITPGARVMVHSSLKSFGHVEDGRPPLGGGPPLGGAAVVIAALMAVITPQGTLMMPSFNHGSPFEPGGAGYYHPCETPTQNGAIPDLFWRMPGVRRSLDPTHPFACWGADSARYIDHHHRTLTMGPQSPLGLLRADGGYALLLGVGYESNTFHHVVEMSTGAPCLGQRSEAYPVRLPDGRRVMGRTWGWRDGQCPINDAAIYAQDMAARGLQHTTQIGACRATLFRLEDGFNVIAGLLRDGTGSLPPCQRCPIRPQRVPQTVASDWDAESQKPLPDSEAWSY